MQQSLTVPQWVQTAVSWLASGVAGGLIVRFYTIWLNRKKPTAEVHLTEANAAEVIIRAGSSAGDAVIRMMARLDEAQGTIDRVRLERDEWRLKALNAQDDAAAAQMFVDQLNAAAKLTVCEHYPHGVRLSDYTPRQLNPPKT
jgi:hypothetical protein